MKHLAMLAAFAFAAPLFAQDSELVTPDSVVAATQQAEWVAIALEDILIMELAPAGDGGERLVVIQLMPPPFSALWVENVRSLARAHWWDGTSVYRVVDNWVAQWGDVTEEKLLPEGVVSPRVGYVSAPVDLKRPIVEEYLDNAYTGITDHRIAWLDGYVGFPRSGYYADLEVWVDGWPIATHSDGAEVWPIHCYGAVGVARNLEDTGTGSELYAVIGHAPRQLDRNIAVVGRVIDGIEHLSTLPRGTGEAGVYETRTEDTPIISVRLASEHPRGDSFAYEYLDTASESFARYVAVRANREDAFYAQPAGGVDICNVHVPVRPVAE